MSTTGKSNLLPVPKTDLVWDWSPDGQTLAVMAGNAGKVFEHPTKGTYPLRQIYLVRPDGSGRELLTTGPMLDSIAACFSPDGTRLAYQERRHHEGRVLHFAVVQDRTHGEPKDLVEFTELLRGKHGAAPSRVCLAGRPTASRSSGSSPAEKSSRRIRIPNW